MVGTQNCLLWWSYLKIEKTTNVSLILPPASVVEVIVLNLSLTLVWNGRHFTIFITIKMRPWSFSQIQRTLPATYFFHDSYCCNMRWLTNFVIVTKGTITHTQLLSVSLGIPSLNLDTLVHVYRTFRSRRFREF